MKAVAVIPGRENSAHILDVDKPKIDEDEVLVRTLEVGIDGTDSEIKQGLYGEAPRNSDFLIIGHESFGVVEEVGRKVRGIKKGEYVVATVRRPDNCINCKAGEYDMCLTGNYTERGIKGKHGYLTEYYKEKPKYLVKVPASLKKIGVLLEPLSIVEKAVIQAYKIQERMLWKPKTAVVLGTGTLGLLAILLLKSKGLEVVAVDKTDYHKIKIYLFKRLGVKHINSKRTPIRDIPKKIKKRIDLVIEATGNSSVALESMHIIGPNGVVCLTGVTGGNNRVEICADCLNLELVLGNKVVFGTVNANRKYFEKGVRDIIEIEGKYPSLLQKIITTKVSFKDFNKAFDLLNGGSEIKVVIKVNK